VCIVEVEGPLTGYRLHEAYRDASGDLDDVQTSQRLDRAIGQAEDIGLIRSVNSIGAQGTKPKTFRLPKQPKVLPRDVGPRALTHVPPAELEYHLPELLSGEDDVEELVPTEKSDDFEIRDPDQLHGKLEEEEASPFLGPESESLLGDDHSSRVHLGCRGSQQCFETTPVEFMLERFSVPDAGKRDVVRELQL
jgi:hypothetical protein